MYYYVLYTSKNIGGDMETLMNIAANSNIITGAVVLTAIFIILAIFKKGTKIALTIGIIYVIIMFVMNSGMFS